MESTDSIPAEKQNEVAASSKGKQLRTLSSSNSSLYSLQVMVDKETQNQEIESRPPKDDWVVSLKGKLEDARRDDEARSWQKVSIYRIPHYLRRTCEEKAYIPQVVSLGPYHRRRSKLQHMERHKWRAIQHILDRNNQDMEHYLNSMKDLEDKARACYQGPLYLTSNQFVEMMLLDGSFMLEILRGAVVEGFDKLGYAPDDPVFSPNDLILYIRLDMIKLENQIPLFVLDKLLELQPNTEDVVAGLAVAKFFQSLVPTMPIDMNMLKGLKDLVSPVTGPGWDPSIERNSEHDQLPDQVGIHCLTVFRKCLMDGVHNNRVPVEGCPHLIHCATELKVAGIKFRKRTDAKLWDIKFQNGTLSIPPIWIGDQTTSLLFNLMAFEQCHLACTKDVTSYVMFLHHLIDSAEDVKHLHYHGIIENCLSSDDEVAKIMNRLGREVFFDIDDNYLSEVFVQINKYYKRRWNTWRANLKERYFNNPWAIISFVAAVVLLIMTAAQTFYTAYGYHRPKN